MREQNLIASHDATKDVTHMMTYPRKPKIHEKMSRTPWQVISTPQLLFSK
jgi:hypothetical protein